MRIVNETWGAIEFTLEDRGGKRELTIFVAEIVGWHKSGYGTIIHLSSGQSFGVKDDYDAVTKMIITLKG